MANAVQDDPRYKTTYRIKIRQSGNDLSIKNQRKRSIKTPLLLCILCVT